MITYAAALARARAIWGAGRTIDAVMVRAIEPGGFDVALNVIEPPEDGALPDRDRWAHMLDVDGRAVCHADCAALDAAAGGAR